MMMRDEVVAILRQMSECTLHNVCSRCPYEDKHDDCICLINGTSSEAQRAARVFGAALALLEPAPVAEQTSATAPAADERENLRCAISNLTSQLNDMGGVIADLRAELADIRAEREPLPKQAQPAAAAKPAVDMVNHPPHYTYGKYECIEEMEILFGRRAVRDYCRCATYKYKHRRGHKDDPALELAKADWYLDKVVELKAQRRQAKERRRNQKTASTRNSPS